MLENLTDGKKDKLDTSVAGIVAKLDEYLMKPRFDGDSCIILNMPENIIKKNKEKLNAAIWDLYKTYASKGFGMFDILVAVETMVDAVKLSAILDTDIKLLLARERSIEISEQELEMVVVNSTSKRAKNAEDDDNDIVTGAPAEEKSYEERLLEDDPDEEAEIMAGLM
ncbi:MAG: hypothetical protein MJZ25_03855 [Fibrobacter sp.]|nr:hypothetical protein [Fibrobacter sp.]